MVYTASIALNCLAKLANEELTSLLFKEVLPLFNCSKSVLRKKTCVLSYKLVLNCSESAPTLVPYLADRLKDPSPNVQISAVTTILRISLINPTLFLVTIPTLFDILCKSKSNWLKIKLIKLLSELYKVEPRLE